MSIRWPELLLIAIGLGLHAKYILLWPETGGPKQFWSSWRNDGGLKKLSKVSLLSAVALALLGVATSYSIAFFGCALLLLAVHLFTLVAVTR